MATTTIEKNRVGKVLGGRSAGRAIGALVALALAAVTVAAVVFVAQAPTAPVERSRVQPPIYTQDELEVFRLVDAGVLPASVLDLEPFRTKQLVAQGLIPRETLIPASPSRPPLYCPEELALMQAVSAGLVPEAALDTESFRAKELIARGLIPWQAAEPCA
jgi:hypothetical protein